MKQTRLLLSATILILLTSAITLMTGCQSSGSIEDLVPNVSATFSGTYTTAGEGIVNPIVNGNSGPPITMFRVIQTGNRVQVQDNNGAKYHGTMNISASGTDSTPVGQFTIEGVDAGGHTITMVGVFTRATNNLLVMDGTWLEEDTGRSASIRGFSVSAQALEPTPTPDDGNTDTDGATTP